MSSYRWQQHRTLMNGGKSLQGGFHTYPSMWSPSKFHHRRTKTHQAKISNAHAKAKLIFLRTNLGVTSVPYAFYYCPPPP